MFMLNKNRNSSDGRNSKFKTQHNIKDIKREMKNIHTEPPSKWRGKQ
jgi:hypothetical protein